MTRKIFIDCGTHLGMGFSKCAKIFNIDHNWEIFGFEANPLVYNQYIKNIQSGNYPPLNNKNITQKQLEADFNNLCIENQIDHNTDPAWSERNSLVDYINQLKKDFKYTNPKEYQKKIEINYEDLPVPIIGYIDFIFDRNKISFIVLNFNY